MKSPQTKGRINKLTICSPAYPIFEQWLKHSDIDQFAMANKWRTGCDWRPANGPIGCSGYRIEAKLSLGGTLDIDRPSRSGIQSIERFNEIITKISQHPALNVYRSRNLGIHVTWDWQSPIPARFRLDHHSLCRKYIIPVLAKMGITEDEICTVGGILFFHTDSPKPGSFEILSRATVKAGATVSAQASTLRPTRTKRNKEAVQDLLDSNMSEHETLDRLSYPVPRILSIRCFKFLKDCDATPITNRFGEINFKSHWSKIELACRAYDIPFASPIVGTDLDSANCVLNPSFYGFKVVDFSRTGSGFAQNIFIG